jgi:hypothetical protein
MLRTALTRKAQRQRDAQDPNGDIITCARGWIARFCCASGRQSQRRVVHHAGRWGCRRRLHGAGLRPRRIRPQAVRRREASRARIEIACAQEREPARRVTLLAREAKAADCAARLCARPRKPHCPRTELSGSITPSVVAFERPPSSSTSTTGETTRSRLRVFECSDG